MKHLIKFTLILFLLVGCKKEIPLTNKIDSKLLEDKIAVRTEEDIFREIENYIYKSSKSKIHTKNSSNKGPNKPSLRIKAITSKMLGYERNRFDTLLFSVRDYNSKKSMLVSANLECEPIIGVLDDPDEDFDRILKMNNEEPIHPFLLNAIKYNEHPKEFSSSEELNSKSSDKNKQSDVGKPGQNGKIISSELLPRVLVEWGQSNYPYNKYTPNNWPAGCVATAIAQAMTVTRHIGNFNGVSLNWDNLIKVRNSAYASTYPDEANTIGLLMREIGRAVNMEYGPRTSGASTKDGIKILELGKEFYALENKGAIKMILDESENNVIIISSRTKKSSWLGVPRGTGHSYIVDGYEIYEDGTDLMHVNYGWNGLYNGYYLTKIWSPYFISSTDPEAIFPHNWKFYCIRKR